MRHRATRSRGFTLLELIVVLVALSAIYLMAMPAAWQPGVRETSAIETAIEAARDSAVRSRAFVRQQLRLDDQVLLLLAEPGGMVVVDSGLHVPFESR